MTSREQFEAWFKPRKERMKNDGIGTLNIVRYCSMAWAGWQASREAVEVELPELFEDDRHAVTDAIRAAGIKVKGE